MVRNLIPQFLVSFYHWFWALIGAFRFGFPSKKLIVIGVTGTKGKTTVTELLAKILETSGEKVAVANGLHFKIGNKEESNLLKMTMPGRGKLQEFLRDAVSAGCKYAVLEVTSEGIKQHRHSFINFRVAALTNLQREHIESHGSFEKYRAAKARLFQATQDIHVVNLDDPQASYFRDIPSNRNIGYTLKHSEVGGPAIVDIDDYTLLSGGITFRIENNQFQTTLLGEFNLSNILCAIAVGRALGIGWEYIQKAVQEFAGVPGRMEFVQRTPFAVILDYAHTPDSLEAVYKTVHSSLQPTNLICVLGAAGGGRDKWKRPVMGGVAAEQCDHVFLTNEDPYDEDPEKILNDIEQGVGEIKSDSVVRPRKAQSVERILDRQEAIKKAIASAEAGDVVMVTGKGAEKWMALAGGKKIPWDDREIARRILGDSHVAT